MEKFHFSLDFGECGYIMVTTKWEEIDRKSLSNCVSMQTFLDIQMFVHFVVFLIIEFQVPLHLTRSNSCEQLFSKVGEMKEHERNYDLSELVDCATSLNKLVTMDLTDGIHGIGKSHKKHKNIWMKIHSSECEDPILADFTGYNGIETNEEVILALQEGFAKGQGVATFLQMNPSTSCRNVSWWDCPWTVKANG